jgi:8-oxo-dGTP pyrophosphatase MutT (NUDIX family)
MSALDTAVRETKEEVGIDLSRDAVFSGYSSPVRTHTGEMDVIPVVFQLKRVVRISHSPEVSGHRWARLEELLLPSSQHTYRFETGSLSIAMPAFRAGDYVVWGLTHRILSSLIGKDSV